MDRCNLRPLLQLTGHRLAGRVYIPLVDDVVAVQHGRGVFQPTMSSSCFRHTGANHVACGRPAQITDQQLENTGAHTGLWPSRSRHLALSFFFSTFTLIALSLVVRRMQANIDRALLTA
jgi:hypothetical protein